MKWNLHTFTIRDHLNKNRLMPRVVVINSFASNWPEEFCILNKLNKVWRMQRIKMLRKVSRCESRCTWNVFFSSSRNQNNHTHTRIGILFDFFVCCGEWHKGAEKCTTLWTQAQWSCTRRRWKKGAVRTKKYKSGVESTKN